MKESNLGQINELPLNDQLNLYSEQLKNYSWKIGIDGPAAAGKGTACDLLVKYLGLKKIETGKMYRAVTWFVSEYKKIQVNDLFEVYVTEPELDELLQGLDIGFQKDEEGLQHVVVNYPSMTKPQDVTKILEDPEIGKMVSLVAKRPSVRDLLEKPQIEMLKKGNRVIEGRDCWQIAQTADVLFYIYADDETLINREIHRQDERGKTISHTEAWKIVVKRNYDDNQHTRGKLLTPDQARKLGVYDEIIDTSGLSPEGVLLEVFKVMHDKVFMHTKSSFARRFNAYKTRFINY